MGIMYIFEEIFLEVYAGAAIVNEPKAGFELKLRNYAFSLYYLGTFPVSLLVKPALLLHFAYTIDLVSALKTPSLAPYYESSIPIAFLEMKVLVDFPLSVRRGNGRKRFCKSECLCELIM